MTNSSARGSRLAGRFRTARRVDTLTFGNHPRTQPDSSKFAGVASKVAGGLALALIGSALTMVPAQAAPGDTTAWNPTTHTFDVDVPNVVRESNIVMSQPNVDSMSALPLGNGSLAGAAWASQGFTVQLNRSDTLPSRLSPGQLHLPGLTALSTAPDFSATLDLYTGVITETGAGITLKSWIETERDVLVVDVSGLEPGSAQSAVLDLQSGRTETSAVEGDIGTLSRTWQDTGETGSGLTFGSLSGLAAQGDSVSVERVTGTGPTVRATFNATDEGTYRVAVASPSWPSGGTTDAATRVAQELGDVLTADQSSLLDAQESWWGEYWEGTDLIQAKSSDGVAQYMENLRTEYFYAERAAMKIGYNPGAQAGQVNMFSGSRDVIHWNASSYWLWNQRTQLTSNMASGNFDLNIPMFDVYLNSMPGQRQWTDQQMEGLSGICTPETMRFNGTAGDGGRTATAPGSCKSGVTPNRVEYWNALSIVSGPEVGQYIWQQYKMTKDTAFLAKYYPFIRETARFLLEYHTDPDFSLSRTAQKNDGYLHAIANAKETQWAILDPITNIVAMETAFPTVIEAADILGITDPDDLALIDELEEAIPKIPPYPRTTTTQPTNSILNADYSPASTAAADALPNTVFGMGYEADSIRNGENVNLEPVWPWGVVNDTSGPLWSIAQRTYTNRVFRDGNDWDMDAVQAARLGQADEFRSRVTAITRKTQVHPNGFAALNNDASYQNLPYIEQMAGVTAAMNEAFIQGHDGIIRIAPAWPSNWEGSGSAHVLGNTVVSAQVRNGSAVTVAIKAGETADLTVRNPWQSQQIQVINAETGAVALASTTDSQVSFPANSGETYLVERVAEPTSGITYQPVSGTPATQHKVLAGTPTRTIGLAAAAPATVTSLSPTSGVATGGTEVTITGTGLSGATGVTFGGAAGAEFSVVNDTRITVTTPAGAVGAVAVIVVDPIGNSAPVDFEYTSASPDGTAVLGAVLGTSAASDTDYGVRGPATVTNDGGSALATIGGYSARSSATGGADSTVLNTLYFAIDDKYAHNGSYDGTFKFSYYDAGTGSVLCHFDSPADNYTGCGSITLANTNTWKTATLNFTNARFNNTENGSSDFRLMGYLPNGVRISIHSVVATITGSGVPDEKVFPPAVTITAPITGSSVPQSTAPSFSGAAEPGASVTVTDGEATACTTAVGNDGTWTCSPENPLATGDHTFIATATDLTETEAAPSAPVTVTVKLAGAQNSVLPAITGAAQVGSELTASAGQWDVEGLSFAYQWLSDGQPVDGATDSTLTVTAALAGKPLVVRVTARADGRMDATATSPSVAVVDKRALVSIIEEAFGLDESDYTKSSWSESGLATARETASSVEAETNASQTEIDDATNSVRVALALLVRRGDPAVLEALIDVADKLSGKLGSFTEESAQSLEVALSAAHEVYDDREDKTAAQLGSASTVLRQALDGLVTKLPDVVKTVLRYAYDSAKGLSNADGAYTDATWAQLQQKIANAKTVLESSSATQVQVDRALAELNVALTQLRATVKKALLQHAFAAAKSLTNADKRYTTASWLKLRSELSEAEKVLADRSATQAQVDAATKEINAALVGLVPARGATYVAKVKLNQSQLRLVRGAAFTIEEGVYYTSGNLNPSYSGEVSWSSSNTKVATVTSNGVISAIGTGSVTITATSRQLSRSGKKLSASIRATVVSKKPDAKVTKVAASVPKSMKKGKTVYVTGTYLSSQVAGVRVTYASTKRGVVTVDRAGRLVAKSKGTARVKVSAGGKTKTYKVVVK